MTGIGGLGVTPGAMGDWRGAAGDVTFGVISAEVLQRAVRSPLSIVQSPTTFEKGVAFGAGNAGEKRFARLGAIPSLYPAALGNRSFLATHNLRLAYVGGSMARGIASPNLVIALARIGALGMFGAAGLSLTEVEAAIGRISGALDPDGCSWGCNLIHSPQDANLEERLIDLYIRRDVRRVEASAFLSLSKAVVRYACAGLRTGSDGQPRRARHLFVKVSREEVAGPFLSPPPATMLSTLVAEGKVTPAEAALAGRLPIADHIIVEADSGGHTDNRPLGSLFPVITNLRDRLARQFGFSQVPHIGAAGGLGAPSALAGAFAMGADFVLLGSVHQAAVESGISDDARQLLAHAGPADVGMTASSDMFEVGAKVQVLTRGTMMAARGNQLYQLYRSHGAIEEIPAAMRKRLETDVFRMPIEEVWRHTMGFFARDPAQLARANSNPKHRMALIFRWYLGNSSRWAVVGETSRRVDYQVWCGPAMGAFNRWTAGSFLEAPEARSVQQIALNLMEGAATVTRAQQLRSFGVEIATEAFDHRPRHIDA